MDKQPLGRGQRPNGGTIGNGVQSFPIDRSPDEPSAYLITGPGQTDNPIITANPAFTRMTGHAQDEVVGHNCRLLQGLETDPETVARPRQAVAEGVDVTVTVLNYHKDETTFWNELTISAVRDIGNRITHFGGVQVDTTAREAVRTGGGNRSEPNVSGIPDRERHACRVLNVHRGAVISEPGHHQICELGE